MNRGRGHVPGDGEPPSAGRPPGSPSCGRLAPLPQRDLPMFEGLRFRHWRTERERDGVVVLTLDREQSSVNSLGRDVLDELGAIVERLGIEPPPGVIIRSGKSGFVVGADLKEFERYAAEGRVGEAIERGHRVFRALSSLRCPTVAAIHGICLGGGTEMALACRYRVASDAESTRIGLPEVLLGIHPGWGGMARLPALIGAPKAVDLMLTGRTVSAASAKELGLVDEVAPEGELAHAAKRLIRQRPGRPFARRFVAGLTNWWPVRQVLALAMKKQVAAKANPKQYPA